MLRRTGLRDHIQTFFWDDGFSHFQLHANSMLQSAHKCDTRICRSRLAVRQRCRDVLAVTDPNIANRQIRGLMAKSF